MFKKSLFFFIFFFISIPVNSHVEHYKDLKTLEFDLYRNNKLIGTHIYTFSNDGDNLIVDSKINFEIKKLGVSLYKYHAAGTETYKDGILINFNSKTNQNKKDKYVNIQLKDDKYIIDGSSYKGDANKDYIIGTWWNHSIVNAKAQISAVSGRIIEQKVTFLGKKTINISGKKIKTLHFNFASTDETLSKGKKMNTDIWYEEDTLNWIKASFEKSGTWEYRLRLAR